jgi:hypothetical protein
MNKLTKFLIITFLVIVLENLYFEWVVNRDFNLYIGTILSIIAILIPVVYIIWVVKLVLDVLNLKQTENKQNKNN